MPIDAGTRLGPYEVVAPIGAGGMGEVYRATDTKLGRDVAVKLLPAAFAADPERLSRFEREARVLASLNHPAIAHLYGFEKATLPDGTEAHFLAMELVEGEDLAELVREIHPRDSSGVYAIENVALSADGAAYAYDYQLFQSDLYVVDGLR